MEIVKVKYNKLISDSNYNNVSFGAEAIVADGETPEDAMTNLAYWVNDKLEKLGITMNDVCDMEDRVCSLKRQADGLEQKIEGRKEKVEWLNRVLKEHGIEDAAIKIPF